MPRVAIVFIILLLCGTAIYAADDKAGSNKPAAEPKAQSLDMVSDTVEGVFNKANALLAGDLEITMSKDKDREAAAKDFTINAMGQKVPTRTAIKSGSALHNDDPL